MTLPVLVAVPGAAESRLLAGWEPLRREVVVVRRCADVADVLAAVGAGLARAVVLGAELPGCDTEVLADLRRRGVGVVVLLPAGAAGEEWERRWRGLGATRFAVEDRPASDVAREVALAVTALQAPSSTSTSTSTSTVRRVGPPRARPGGRWPSGDPTGPAAARPWP